MKKIILTLMLAVVSLSSFAQFGGGQFQMPKPEEMATRRADQVKEQVKDAGQLTDDQYKKVYDLYLKQSKDMQAKMNEGGGGFGAFNMEDMQKQQDMLIAPITQKLQNAIQAVGAEGGYTFIFDQAAGSLLYTGTNAEDVSAKVKAKLGIK